MITHSAVTSSFQASFNTRISENSLDLRASSLKRVLVAVPTCRACQIKNNASIMGNFFENFLAELVDK